MSKEKYSAKSMKSECGYARRCSIEREKGKRRVDDPFYAPKKDPTLIKKDPKSPSGIGNFGSQGPEGQICISEVTEVSL